MTIDMLYLAESDFQGLVWVIIFIFWIFAQIVGQAAKKKKPLPPPRKPNPQDPHESKPTIQDELQDFLQSLTGQTPQYNPYLDEEEEDTYTLELEPEPQPVTPPPLPPPIPVQAVTSDLQEVEEKMLSKEVVDPFKYEELATLSFEPDLDGNLAEVFADHSKLINTSVFMVGVSSLKMPIIRTPLMTDRQGPPSQFKPNFKSRDELKKALVSRIILGPPTGMQDELGSNVDAWRR